MNQICCRIKEACAASGIGRTKLYEMINAGEIQTVKVGKSRLILWDSLMKRLIPEPIPSLAHALDEQERTGADTKVKKIRLRPRG